MTSASIQPAGVRAALPPSAARAIIRRHSATFSLASLLLGRATRENAHVLYAYCRRADDAIDLASPARAKGELERLRSELDAIYAGQALPQPVASEFQRLVFELQLPREYPEALLQGFELDVSGARYTTMFELHRYCWCVAGSVGAMMCHVLGARQLPAIVHGVHLGMAMQLTNVCRDVAEDWTRGRLYLPLELVPGWAELEASPLESWPPDPRRLQQLAGAVERLLAEADVFYRSGDAGLGHLPWRARVAVATARRVYSAIGQRLLARHADVTTPRAVVPTSRKLWCAARAVLDALPATGPRTPSSTGASAPPLRFPDDVLPI
jgi:15-cis-phytoene synthase